MLEWILRGLRKGSATTGYPRRPEPAPANFRGRVEVIGPDPAAGVELICPTGAIAIRDGRFAVDRGRCVLCGLCVTHAPARFAFANRYETAATDRAGLWGDAGDSAAGGRVPLAGHARTLRRSIHIRHVDAGSDGSEEWEIMALHNPYYDFQRLGFAFTAAPRHADILLVTGAGTESMRLPLLRAWEVMPEPKAVVAVGTDACSGGLAGGADASAGGIDRILPVDVYVPGAPPSPIAILDGLLMAAGIVNQQRGRR